MKISVLMNLVAIALATGVMAGVQNYTVTPSSLSDWAITGADLKDIPAQPSLTLPAGTELARAFSGGAVILYTTSHPHFSQASSDWPVLQVGPAALALTRLGHEGQALLLVGESLTVLPFTVSLDADGHSRQVLEIALGYDPVAKVGVVGFGDQALAFQDTNRSNAVTVSVSAGANDSWVHDIFEVLVLSKDSDAGEKSVKEADAGKHAALLQATMKKLRQTGAATGIEDTSVVRPGLVPAKTPLGRTSTLEVFTPPAVRRSAGDVRATVAQATTNNQGSAKP